jgi:hypothetical protein
MVPSEHDQAVAGECYTVTPGALDAHSADVLTLWTNGLTHGGKPEAKLSWYYRENVQGAPTLFFLRQAADTNPVGVAAVGVRLMRFNNQLISAGALVDFVIKPEHRTLFPALLLQRTLREKSLTAHSVLYGLPNPKSLAVVKRAGYDMAGQMVRRARVVRTASYLTRYIPHWLARLAGPVVDFVRLSTLRLSLPRNDFLSQWINQPDARFDTLWQSVNIEDTLIGQRDCAFLHWRFTRSPLNTYKFFVLETKAHRLVAYAVCEERECVLHVRDFLVDPSLAGAFPALWSKLIVDTHQRGNSAISVEFLGNADISRAIESAGLRHRESRPLYISVDPFADSALLTLKNEKAWYLTSADEDW